MRNEKRNVSDPFGLSLADFMARPALTGAAAVRQLWRDEEVRAQAAVGELHHESFAADAGDVIELQKTHTVTTSYVLPNVTLGPNVFAFQFTGFTDEMKASGRLSVSTHESIGSEVRPTNYFNYDRRIDDYRFRHVDATGDMILVPAAQVSVAHSVTRERLQVAEISVPEFQISGEYRDLQVSSTYRGRYNFIENDIVSGRDV